MQAKRSWVIQKQEVLSFLLLPTGSHAAAHRSKEGFDPNAVMQYTHGAT